MRYFLDNKFYKKVFLSNRNYIFDEFGRWGVVGMNEFLKKNNDVRLYLKKIIMEEERENLLWDNGKLIRVKNNNEIFYFHFIKEKNNSFYFPYWKEMPEKFYITPFGISRKIMEALYNE
jgi:hypothetical protein